MNTFNGYEYDKVRCELLGDLAFCKSYCNSISNMSENCSCRYFDNETQCSNWCNGHSNRLECRCNYLRDLASCFESCDTENSDGECECKMLMDSDACSKWCNSKYSATEALKRHQCLCDYAGVDTSCTALCNGLEVEIRNLCKCLYNATDETSCTAHCNSQNSDANKANCKCALMPTPNNCNTLCETSFPDSATNSTSNIALWKCKCDDDEKKTGSACTTYCNLAYPQSTLDASKCRCVQGHSWNNSTTQITMCNAYCSAVNVTADPDAVGLCTVMCSAYSQSSINASKCFCEDLHVGARCERYCRAAYNETNCRRYCDSLSTDEEKIACRCENNTDPFLCREFCNAADYFTYNATRCAKYCASLYTAKAQNECNCKYNLNVTACRSYCSTLDDIVAQQQCLCNHHVRENTTGTGDITKEAQGCAAYCESLSTPALRSKCACDSLDNVTKCTDYCNTFSTAADRAACKCNHNRGTTYCREYCTSRYAGDDLAQSQCLCEVLGLADACGTYHRLLVAQGGSPQNEQRYRCEIEQDLASCMALCVSLPLGSAEFLECKCNYYDDVPSCMQLCDTYDRSTPEYATCRCVHFPEEDPAACARYCAEVGVVYGAVQEQWCRCNYLDNDTACGLYCGYADVLPGGETLCRCEWQWEGWKENCNAHCNTMNATDKKWCKCWYMDETSQCLDYCNTLTPASSKQACLCEYVEDRSGCVQMCNAQQASAKNECLCTYTADTQACQAYCTTRFMNKGLTGEYDACMLVNANTYEAYMASSSSYCDEVEGSSVKSFCSCALRETAIDCNTHCMNYSSSLYWDMCQCYHTYTNDTRCSRFCEESYSVGYLCSDFCQTLANNEVLFEKCQCDHKLSSCESYCGLTQEYDSEEYWYCRCSNQKDNFSCLMHCDSLFSSSARLECRNTLMANAAAEIESYTASAWVVGVPHFFAPRFSLSLLLGLTLVASVLL